MLKRPKRDVFEFSGRQANYIGRSASGLILTCSLSPAQKQLSTLLDMEPAVQHEEEEREKNLSLFDCLHVCDAIPIGFGCERTLFVVSLATRVGFGRRRRM